jgi:hypothetical protein
MPYRPGAGPQKESDLVSIEDVYRSENVFVNNVAVALHEAPGTFEGGSPADGGVFIPTDTYVYDEFHANDVLQIAGVNAPLDDENAFAGGSFDGAAQYPNADASLQPQAPGIPTDEPLPPGRVPSGIPVTCGAFIVDPIDYDQNLSPNYTIRNLSIGAVFKHAVRPQRGLSTQDILCNMQALAVNIIEPLRVQFPGFNINSGFRQGNTTSQHQIGQALDVQWPGLPSSAYNEIAVWIITNLPFDQFIFEHGKNIWLHISYNRFLNNQRNQILTMYQGNFAAGLRNYYSPSTPWPSPPEEENGEENGNGEESGN